MEEKDKKPLEEENAFQIENEELSKGKEAKEVPDKAVEKANDKINLDENLRDRG